ncbi:hypothetical protein [Nocardia aurantiaca]|uniref:Uncharacterized protein n=1 Tax=Nocardia aurantiaca TaxID=2675850 RepID=A0A6I3L1Y2_9NOCA|nr:hypothetical protein [Nocardia aurantiaca]MTE17013.1 hypothetical protein [Nocardia aurantiaca]
MEADFTTGPGDSRPARQPGYRLTHPDTPSPGASSNPVLTGIDLGGHAGPGHNGHEQAVQWSSAPVTLRSAPEPDALPRRFAPELPQRIADPEAVAARLAAEGEPFSARSTTDGESFAAAVATPEPFAAQPVANGSLYARSMSDSGAFTRPAADGDPFDAPAAADGETLAVRPATNGSPFAGRTGVTEDVASPAVEIAAPVARRYAPDPEPPARHESPARLDSPAPALDSPAPRLEAMETLAASLRDSAQDSRRESTAPVSAPSRRRAAPEPTEAQADSIPAETKAGAEFRTSDATIDLHHIMRLLVASHDLDVAAAAVESGEITVAELAETARRTRTAAVELVAAWYGGADHMRKFGEVLLQAAAETA